MSKTVIEMAKEAGLDDYLDRGTILVEDLLPFAALVAAQEREECAKVCENIAAIESASLNGVMLRSMAGAIRARKEETP